MDVVDAIHPGMIEHERVWLRKVAGSDIEEAGTDGDGSKCADVEANLFTEWTDGKCAGEGNLIEIEGLKFPKNKDLLCDISEVEGEDCVHLPKSTCKAASQCIYHKRECAPCSKKKCKKQGGCVYDKDEQGKRTCVADKCFGFNKKECKNTDGCKFSKRKGVCKQRRK